jgi:RHS repeat-associated protein
MKASEPASGYKTRTYYINDAAGNVLATYSTIKTGENTKLTLNEQHLYGSKRIGILKRAVELADNSSTLYYYPSDSSVTDISYTNPDSLPATVTYTGELPQPYGDRLYELASHLGNVQAVISDIKIPVGTDTTLNHYKPDVVAMNDYCSFGMPMPGRNLNINGFRYGFGNQQNDDEINGIGNRLDFGARIYDAKLARFRSRDQLSDVYAWYSPYLFAGNNPILFIDVDGLRPGMNTAFLLPEPVLTGKRDANMIDIMSSGAMFTAPVAGTFNMFRKLQAQYRGATTYRRMVYKVGTFQDFYSGGNMESVIAEYEDAKTTGEPGKTFEDGLNAVSVPGSQAAGFLAKLPVATGTMLREVVVTAKSWRKNLKLGRSFEKEYLKHLKDEGWEVTRNVSVKAWDEVAGRYRRTVIDFVARKDGVTRFIETKLRDTTPFSSSQKFVYKKMEEMKAFFTGNKAKDAYFKPGSLFTGTVERVNKYTRNADEFIDCEP